MHREFGDKSEVGSEKATEGKVWTGAAEEKTKEIGIGWGEAKCVWGEAGWDR